MNEAETRAEHIDPALAAAGWGVVAAQAKDYAGKLALQFTYATNGRGIYGIDMQTAVGCEIATYPTLEKLAEKDFGKDQLAEMQTIIDAERSDLFDVLAHVAYALEPLTREERADRAMAAISENFNSQQQAFLDFVLSHYIAVGVEDLDQAKLTPLLKLKYHDSIANAVADLGKPDEIDKMFSRFQQYLYVEQI